MTQGELEDRVGPRFSVDPGWVIGGPFIPDGRVRIYDEETLSVVAEGEGWDEAWEDFNA